jgi:hypothetical protein
VVVDSTIVVVEVVVELLVVLVVVVDVLVVVVGSIVVLVVVVLGTDVVVVVVIHVLPHSPFCTTSITPDVTLTDIAQLTITGSVLNGISCSGTKFPKQSVYS